MAAKQSTCMVKMLLIMN